MVLLRDPALQCSAVAILAIVATQQQRVGLGFDYSHLRL